MRRKFHRSGPFAAGFLASIASLLLLGCQPTGYVWPETTIAARPNGALTATPILAPAVTVTEQASTTLVPGSPTAMAFSPAPPTPIPTVRATSTPTAIEAATPTVSPTPAPTFTPPPPPAALAGEHLLFGRPVDLETAPWTDKVYPYGSTRGGSLQAHHGVEFNVGTGTPVLAAGAGTVVVAGDDLTTAYGPTTDFYGNLVVIDHGPVAGQPVFTLYGHLSALSVIPGQTVNAGEPIGLSGDSGVAYGPHLHFEVRAGTNRYNATRNPLLWLLPLANTGLVVGRVSWPDGQAAAEVPITLRRLDGPSPYTATTSYAAADLNSDDLFQENFVLDDVIPGYYEIQAGDDGPSAELWVWPGRMTAVDLVLEP